MSETGGAEQPTAPAQPSRITLEEFQRVELRTAQVLEAERVEGSKKLLRLVVDLGTEKRQLVAGIARKYEPQQLVGRKIIVVANLQPARLMGIESNGMVLAAVAGDEPVLAGFLEEVPNGSRLR